MKFRKCFDPHVSCRPGLVTANQHIFKSGLSNIWSSIHEKVKQHRSWVETKRCLYKKRVLQESWLVQESVCAAILKGALFIKFTDRNTSRWCLVKKIFWKIWKKYQKTPATWTLSFNDLQFEYKRTTWQMLSNKFCESS